MGRDKQGKQREARTVEAHLFLDLRRHADRAVELGERVFAREDKAARETFADLGQARRWLAEIARQRAPCLGLGKSAAGSPVLRRPPCAIAGRSANAGHPLTPCDTLGRQDRGERPPSDPRVAVQGSLRPCGSGPSVT